MQKIIKKPLSGSNGGKEIDIGKLPTLIHETPPNLEYSEIWVYAINKTDHPIKLNVSIKDETVYVMLSVTRSPIALFGEDGNQTFTGFTLHMSCDETNAVSVIGWVNEVEMKNG